MLALESSYLRGSIPSLVTPFRGTAVDYDAYATLVEVQVNNGSHGILVNGPAAEPASLTMDERNRLVAVAAEAVAGRVTIVVATGAQSYAETEALTRFAADDPDVDALLIGTPLSHPPQRGLVSYYKALNAVHDKPWLISHMPSDAELDLTVETASAIDKACPTFVGMNHASADPVLVCDLMNEIGEDFRIFAGLEESSLPLMAVGACGVMNTIGNLCPRPLADMCEAVWDNDLLSARDVYRSLVEVNRAVTFDVNPIPIKYMMKRLGIIPGNEHRLPLVPARTDLEKQLESVLRSAGMIR